MIVLIPDFVFCQESGHQNQKKSKMDLDPMTGTFYSSSSLTLYVLLNLKVYQTLKWFLTLSITDSLLNSLTPIGMNMELLKIPCHEFSIIV